jgi:polyisoprenyl-teichoic acid--peptidoglycan teichoic acid transferase
MSVQQGIKKPMKKPLNATHKMLWLLLLATMAMLPLQAQDAPAAMPLLEAESAHDISNILLIGSAISGQDSNAGLTDTLMILSINRDTNHAALLSVPRDLHVYAPGMGMMKINQAYYLGELRNEERGGVGVLKETITHNLGLEIDYYAIINFNGFSRLIDALGGIFITVDCVIEDWILSEPHLDKDDPENYEMFTLPTGLHRLDGHTALWYVRSRRTSSDIDRGRRQQDVLRAIWHRLQDGDWLENLPRLWDTFTEYVETDLTLADAMGYAPFALQMDTADLSYYTFRIGREVENAYTSYAPRRFILEPNRDELLTLMQQVIQPPTRNRINGHRPTIAVINASGVDGLDYVAADRLELEGFDTRVIYEWSIPREYNKVVDYTGISKGNPRGTIQRVMRITDAGVELQPDPQREYDYKLFIGNFYQFNACTRPVIQPDLREAATD